MPPEVLFYHLERASLTQALPGLLAKTLDRGWRATVRCGDAAAVASLDEALWTFDEESFLPHGAGGDAAAAAREPIWLTADETASTDADVLFAVANARVSPEDVARHARTVVMFDGADDAAVGAARALWKELRGAAVAATYWRQDGEGRWAKRG